ncbi:hypothetical protein H5410_052259 [Solanum commersonii]|uniref:Uncharacterized protein n=1 Tax=Solanum commersonii TaxID=4109 RepID=A0A9J5X3I8_SOLCO|nr:hypothetical protein H5410_052259 [Solanum commersonii]
MVLLSSFSDYGSAGWLSILLFGVEIQKLFQSDSSLTNTEVVEKCFGPQRKSHVIGFVGGITTKELKGGNSLKAALLDK